MAVFAGIRGFSHGFVYAIRTRRKNHRLLNNFPFLNGLIQSQPDYRVDNPDGPFLADNGLQDGV
ncbi:hypothetical protein ABW22_11665 [Thiobacillus denitrificans]|uniref:Uncharacterized protein n=1 Tax=Thiobacillus denitrificans TaxID=36861 RepID=A0A106BLJ4_THIDE|nr:hypothetical protein ABW22_11665 [Thiobacillus denitrificans]